MTVPNEVDWASYPGTGSTGPFTYSFKIYQSSELDVFKVNDATGAVTDLALTTGYTIAAGSVGSDSGSITLTAALASGYTLWIFRNLAFTQGAVFKTQAQFDAGKNEDCMDKSVMRDLQLKRKVDRSFHIPLGADPDDYNLEITPAANTILGFDANSNFTVYGASNTTITPLSDDVALALGTASAGVGTKASRYDHVHPSEALSSATPEALGSASAGVGTLASRSDHVHPSVANATTSTVGVVELATDGETASGVVVQGNDSRLVRRSPTFWYGDGSDGALSLGSNTTLSSGDNIKYYTDLTLNTYTLKANAADKFLIIYVSGTLALGTGSIQTSAATAAAGGAASTSGGGGVSGAGGAGGAPNSAVWVFAKNITGTGSIKSSNDGVDGGAASSPSSISVAVGANAGTAATNAGFIYGQAANYPSNPGGGTGAAGGIGSATYTATNVLRNYLLLQNWLYITGDVSITVTAPWKCQSLGGGGGASGAIQNSTGDGGGGGGGGGAGYGASGAGGKGGAGIYSGLPAGGSAAYGGGGGGGAGGGTVVVITDNASSSFTVSAKGGNGGPGASGLSSLDGSIPGAGGGGGGGGGGLAIFIGQPGNTVTVTAAAGTGGAGGAAVDGGGAGVAGSDGGVGISKNLTW